MPDSKMPPEAMTPAAEAFTAMHEVYTGLRAAGFSLWEAAAVIGAILASQQGAPGAGGGN